MKYSYATFIKELRQKKGYLQQEVSEKLGISRTSYISLEKGKRELFLGEAGILCELFDTTFENLLSGGGEKYKKYKQMFFAFLRNLEDDGKVPKTKLAKLLYLADFAWFYNYHESMSGLKYRKIEHGPVPDYYFRLLEELEGDGEIAIDPKNKALLISETRTGEKVGNDLLNKKEQKLIADIASKWKDKNTKEIVDFAHSQLPYTFTDKDSIIPYELITQEDPQHVY